MPLVTARLPRPAAVGALVLAAALGTAGCTGGSGPSATTTTSAPTSATSPASPTSSFTTTGEVFTASQKALNAAASAHVKGRIADAGQTMTIDLAGTRDGANQSVTVNLNEGEISILTVGGQFYLKADGAFWKTQGLGTNADKLAGKYVQMPAAQAKALADFSVSGFLSQVFTGKEATAMAKSTAAPTQESVDGVSAYVVKDSGTAVYIATDTLLPVKLTAPNGAGTLEFSEWNAVKPFTAPAAGDIVDPATVK